MLLQDYINRLNSDTSAGLSDVEMIDKINQAIDETLINIKLKYSNKPLHIEKLNPGDILEKIELSKFGDEVLFNTVISNFTCELVFKAEEEYEVSQMYRDKAMRNGYNYSKNFNHEEQHYIQAQTPEYDQVASIWETKLKNKDW